MKKLLFKIVCLFMVSALAAAEPLRNGVCIVRSNLSEKTVSFLTTYRDSLKSQGYTKYASGIDEYLKGSFGSGFVYEANGKKYIVTNRHVVVSADTAKAQFEKEDGTFDEYDSLKIVAVNDDIDIALIECPADFNKYAFTVNTETLNDGDDVWTAGFPGLAGAPAWQFGKGAVTNAFARIDELVPADISSIIQHSAQIDGGNSGGPLLIKNADSPYGYSVVGVNIWKAFNRENTNFSVPMKTVKEFIDDVIEGENKNASIDNRLTRFNSSIANKEETFGRMSTFISNDMVSSLSSSTFLKITEKASAKAQDIIIDNFAADPIEGIRYALASYIWNSFRKKGDLLPYTVSAPDAEGDSYNVTFVINEKTQFSSKWIKEQGIWKIADFNGLVEENGSAVGNSKVTIDNPYAMELFGGFIMPGYGNFDFTVGFNFAMDKFINYGFVYSSTSMAGNQYNVIGVDVELIVPVNVGNFIIAPYGYIGYGIFLLKGGSAFDFNFGFNYGGGVEVGYDLGSIAPYAAIQYNGSSFKPDAFADIRYKKNAISVNAGLKFGKTKLLKLW